MRLHYMMMMMVVVKETFGNRGRYDRGLEHGDVPSARGALAGTAHIPTLAYSRWITSSYTCTEQHE